MGRQGKIRLFFPRRLFSANQRAGRTYLDRRSWIWKICGGDLKSDRVYYTNEKGGEAYE